MSRYGADQFLYGWSGDDARVGFRLHGRQIIYRVPLPDQNSDEFRLTPTGQERAAHTQRAGYEQAIRQRWRALALVIKAKLEAVDAGITTIEDEFLANTMLPDGQTVGDWAEPMLQEVYLSGKMPMALLPGMVS